MLATRANVCLGIIVYNKKMQNKLSFWLIDSCGVMCDQPSQIPAKVPLEGPHLELLHHFIVVIGKHEMMCGWVQRAKWLFLIPAFLHTAQDSPKPQTLTTAEVPNSAAKIHCEQYSCFFIQESAIRIYSRGNKKYRDSLCPEKAQIDLWQQWES